MWWTTAEGQATPVMLEAYMASDSGFRKARRRSGHAC
ncbi:MAG: DUF2274 domain-containing protein [Hyphomonas sp.]|nr:DUF2274 domain-containing protein [Hyphomonas sp.]